MSRINSQRSLRIFPTQSERDDDLNVALPATTLYSNKIRGPKYGGRHSIQLQWTAGPTGAFTIQYTLKSDPNEANDNDWVTDTSATVVGTSLSVAGGAGNSIIFVGNVLPEWVRIKWAYTSGSASTVGGWSRAEGDV